MHKHVTPSKVGTVLPLLVILLAGCGQAAASPTSSAGSGPATPTSTPTPPAAPSLAFNAPAAADLDGLHLQLSGLDCGAHPVLKEPPRSSYDSGTLQQMINYLAAFAQETTYGMRNFQGADPPLPPVPDPLQLVPGVIDGRADCRAGLEVTNIGTESIQITGIGVTLTTAPVENQQGYRLIDVCTLPPEADCGGEAGGAGCGYSADVELAGGQAGTHLETPVDSGDSEMCPTIVDPGHLLDIAFRMSSKKPNLLYQVSLALIFTRAGKPKTLNLPAAFTSTLVFANSRLISCYGLKGNTFVPVPYRYHPYRPDLLHPSDGICV